MGKQNIFPGSTPNDGTGDTLYQGALKINNNFNEIYSTFGDGTNLYNVTGPQGAQGAQGDEGAQGAQGDEGAQGAQGDEGAQGAQGDEGAQGAQGDEGAQGAQGASGTSGTSGAQGSTGPTGAQGASGAQGATGAQGSSGSTGAQGDIGAQGAQGIPGTASAQGAQGDTGAQGFQGDIGTQGAQGDFGAQGAQGNQGIIGPQGAQGAQGDQGPIGSPQWGTTAAGINTLSNVGIGTTNPTSALTVKGNTSLETLSVSGVSTFPINVAVGVDFAHQGGGIGKFRISGDGVYGNGRLGFYDSSNNLTAAWDSYPPSGKIDIYNYTNSGTQNITISAGSSVVLQHGGTNTKLQTLGAGVTVTGTTFTNQLNVSGVSTFSGDGSNSYQYFTSTNAYLDFASTFNVTKSGVTYISVSGNTAALSENTTVNGAYWRVRTLPTGAEINGTLESNQLSVSGVSTLNSNVSVGGTISVDGGVTVTGTTFTNELSVSGVSTFQNHVYFQYPTHHATNPTRAYFGSLDEMSIYSTGTYLGNSYNYIDASSGYLDIRNLRTTIRNSENTTQRDLAIFDATTFNGEFVKLYYGGNEKIATLGAGVTVTGTTFTNELSVSGISTSQGGFTSGIGVTNPVQITVTGNTLTFTVVGIGSASLTLV